MWSTDSVVAAHGLSCSMSCGSSQTRDRIHVPCIGRQMLNPWTTRSVPDFGLLFFLSDCCGYSSVSPCYSSVGNSADIFILEFCDYILMHICMDFINPAKACGMLFHRKSFWFCFFVFSSNKDSWKILP